MLEGSALEIVVTAANSAAQAWYGYDQGIIAGILVSNHFLETFPQVKDSVLQGTFSSIFSAGNLVGCGISAAFGDKLGRKNTLRIGALISAIGAILQASSYSFTQLMIGRTINGVGNGMTSSTCGVFQAEASISSRRGKMSVIVVTHNVIFYMLGSWLTLGTSYIDSSGQWRIPFALQIFPATVLVSLLFLVPESPRWLLLRDRHDDAIESLRRYLGKGLDVEDDVVQMEFKSIRGALEIERMSKSSFKDVLLCKDRSSSLKRMLLGMGTQIMQQLGGINALNYYFTIILVENLNMSELMARVLTGVNATTYTISTACAFWIIERAGRRFLMLWGLVLQGFAYIMVAIAVGSLSSAPQEWGGVAIAFLFFYYAAFGCTWGMVPWIYQAEINSLGMRVRGAAAATSMNWLFGFVCTQFTSVGIRNLGYKFYIMFAVFNIGFFPIVYFLYPETANRTLEDMDSYFDKDSPHTTIIAIGNKVAKQHRRPTEAIEAEHRRIALASRAEEIEQAKAKTSSTWVEDVTR